MSPEQRLPQVRLRRPVPTDLQAPLIRHRLSDLVCPGCPARLSDLWIQRGQPRRRRPSRLPCLEAPPPLWVRCRPWDLRHPRLQSDPLDLLRPSRPRARLRRVPPSDRVRPAVPVVLPCLEGQPVPSNLPDRPDLERLPVQEARQTRPDRPDPARRPLLPDQSHLARLQDRAVRLGLARRCCLWSTLRVR